MNSEEDEFKRIEREAKRRAQADDDDTQEYVAQRVWVGLTEEEIKATWSQLWYDLNHGKLSAPDAAVRSNVVVFGEALEAKLKEKNT